MGKSKKFIDKKKATTYRLFARDTYNSTSSNAEADSVFVRVDNNPAPSQPIFSDESQCIENGTVDYSVPDHGRKEILSLGLPDDGYNYLIHLREIKNSGASIYFQNPKADLSVVPNDIKAYDASRVAVALLKTNEDNNDSIFETSKSTKNINVERAIDHDVLALLHDSDSSMCGSEADELEEDFIIQANLPIVPNDAFDSLEPKTKKDLSCFNVSEMPHQLRLLDEQFDMLEHQEYESEEEEDGYREEEVETLEKKLSSVFCENVIINMDDDESDMAPEDVLKRCAEYGKVYEEEFEVGELVRFEESSDDSEEWDCETIVSTYSNLENHPGRIGPPAAAKMWEALCRDGSSGIAIGGRKIGKELRSGASGSTIGEGPKIERRCAVAAKKVVGLETKEEKRERKAALKGEKREGRRIKKEVKSLYKGESQSAQRAAALCCPSSIHLL